MKEKIDLKKRMREIKFTTEYTLTPDQFRKRLEDKVERARVYLNAQKRLNLFEKIK